MSPAAAPLSLALPPVWTCPFCPLLCEASPEAPLPPCTRREARLAGLAVPAAVPCSAGAALSPEAATTLAAAWLRQARQPLFGGLGTEVGGARALQALAAATGAIGDAAAGEALTQALRAQQDRGGFSTTLAEVHERADLIVFVGSWPAARAPLLGRRLGEQATRCALGAPEAPPEVPVVAAPDLFSALASLAAVLDGRAPRDLPVAWQALADQLQAARYAVLVWEPAQLGPQAALLIERLNTVVGLLNRHGRAAGLPIGGGLGAASVQQTWAWRTGLPLRSRVGPHGAEHEPLRFGAARLLADGAVDLLLWLAAFGETPPPATPGLRRIVLGPPELAGCGDEPDTLFIPVGTPGLDHAGHLHRCDGVVVLPLHAARAPQAPAAEAVLARLLQEITA